MSSLFFALFTIEVSSADSVYLRFLELFLNTTKVFSPIVKKIGNKRTHGGQRVQTKLARSSPQWALHINYSAESRILTTVSLLRPPLRLAVGRPASLYRKPQSGRRGLALELP